MSMMMIDRDNGTIILITIIAIICMLRGVDGDVVGGERGSGEGGRLKKKKKIRWCAGASVQPGLA